MNDSTGPAGSEVARRRLSRNGRRAVISGALVAVVGAVAWLFVSLRTAEQKTGELERAATALEVRVQVLESQLRTHQDTTGDRLDAAEAEIVRSHNVTLDILTGMSYDITGVERALRDLEFALGDLTSCVNEYMDTIGDWSGNVYSYYTYYYC